MSCSCMHVTTNNVGSQYGVLSQCHQQSYITAIFVEQKKKNICAIKAPAAVRKQSNIIGLCFSWVNQVVLKILFQLHDMFCGPELPETA